MISFHATECGYQIQEEAITCGASNSKDEGAEWHSLTFQREVEGSSLENWGPYFEIDDQSQGFYTRTARVELLSNVLTVRVVPPRKQQFGHRVIVVDLSKCPRKSIAALKKGLRLVFRDAPGQFRDA